MKPVMKQYAASGNVDLSPSTSPMRCSLLKIACGDMNSAYSLRLDDADAGRGSAPFSPSAVAVIT